jgi:hypothetical protein
MAGWITEPRANAGVLFARKALEQFTNCALSPVAPTGIAALNAQAQTIHSFFQFPFGVLDWRDVAPSRNNGQLLRRMERLVIDEISMVRADILDSIDAKLRQSRSDDRPFGGVQVGTRGRFPAIASGHDSRGALDPSGA